MDYRKRNWYLVLGGIIAYTAVIGGLSLALAIRDAEHAADFIFKWFGAGMAFLFATAGPFGLAGLALMSGKLRGASMKVVLLFPAFLSVLLVAYVCDQFNVMALFR
jgi:hypothetical protein